MKSVQKIAIIPSNNQVNTFDFWLRRCCKLYNAAIEQRLEYYKKKQTYLGYYEQKKELPLLKQEDNSWKDIPNKSLTETLERLEKAYKKFFREPNVGFPKPKNSDTFKSVYFVKEDVRIVNDYEVRIPKIKTTIKLSEKLKTNLFSSVVLKKDNNSFYLIFNCDDGKGDVIYDKESDKQLSCVGVDLGLKTLLTDSKGNTISRFSIKLTKKYTDRIAELNKSLSTCKKGSRRRVKVKKQLGKTYSRIKNTREDYHKKESSKYVNKLISDNVQCLVIGDIEVKKIVCKDNSKSKRYLRRSFGLNGLSNFKTILSKKGELSGLKVYRIKEHYTSKTCSCCGLVTEVLLLSDRVFKCRGCNNSIDRDENASINIKAVWHGQFKPYRLDSQGNKHYLVINYS